MRPGEVVRMKSAAIQFDNAKARGAATMKAAPGKQMYFIFLGGYDPENPDAFQPREILKAMGWIPGPELQADIDADAAADLAAQAAS
ncbi:MAG: hypothetical protein JWQ01_4841 [Massilia sp.]|nr:hypothetical protein [Massilia sp.]